MFSKHIKIGPDSTRDAVVLNLLINGGTNAVSARLPAAAADDLIAKLGSARAALKQPVEADLDPYTSPADQHRQHGGDKRSGRGFSRDQAFRLRLAVLRSAP